MSQTITCPSCQTVLGVPKAGFPAEGIICNWCGTVVAEPTRMTSPKKRPSSAVIDTDIQPIPAARDTSVQVPQAERPMAAPHKWGDDEDDNGEAYDVPADEIKTRKCVACGKDIDGEAILCVHCGHDARSNTKAERTFQPIDREWEAGWPFQRRLSLFLAIQVVNVLTLVVSWEAGASVSASLFGILMFVTLQAFLLGTFDRVRVRRNKRGQAEITKTWRVCFIPRPMEKINWKEKEGVVVGVYDASGISDWYVFFSLLFFAIIPAIVFWWYVMRTDRYFTALARDSGFPDIYLYRGMSEEQSKDIARVTADATGLPHTRPLK